MDAEIARRLMLFRKSSNLHTREALANAVGLSPHKILRMETGGRIQISVAVLLCVAMDVDPGLLFKGIIPLEHKKDLPLLKSSPLFNQ